MRIEHHNNRPQQGTPVVVEGCPWTDGTAGDSNTKQLAADAAREAWPKAVAQAREIERAAKAHQMLRQRLDEIAAGMPYQLTEFNIDSASKEHLTKLTKECRDRWEPAYRAGREVAGIEKLMNAASAELFRRRTLGG
jgi:hypothetical protein